MIFHGPLLPGAAQIQSGGGPTAYTLTCDAGSFTLSGQDATLTKTSILVADAGSFSLTGQDATLALGRVLTAEAGSYALTGQDAGLTLTPAAEAPRIVSDGTFIWNWLYGKKRKRIADEIDEEVAEAAAEVAAEIKAQDDAAASLALDRLESALAEAVARNRGLVERALYAQLLAAIEAEQERLRRLQIERLEAHLSARAAYRAMIDAEAVELLSLLELIE